MFCFLEKFFRFANSLKAIDEKQFYIPAKFCSSFPGPGWFLYAIPFYVYAIAFILYYFKIRLKAPKKKFLFNLFFSL